MGIIDIVRLAVLFAGASTVGCVVVMGWRLRGTPRANGCWSIALLGLTALIFQGQRIGEPGVTMLLFTTTAGITFGILYLLGFWKELQAMESDPRSRTSPSSPSPRRPVGTRSGRLPRFLRRR